MLASTTIAKKKQDKCTALALSGGGNNGSWEVGVFWGMVNYGDAEDFKFDVMTGVSAGAINTGVMSGWEIGTEKELADWGSDLWNTSSRHPIRKIRKRLSARSSIGFTQGKSTS